MAKKPSFETFRRYKVTEGDVPFVALHHRGIFALNKNAFDVLGQPEAVEILYAPEERIIGFKASSKSSPDSYSVRNSTKTAFQVEGRSFLKYYKIPENARGRRYRAELVDDDLLTIDLDQDTEDA